MTNKIITIFLFGFSVLSQNILAQTLADLQVSPNKRFLQTKDGKPFFWLGDTGWLLFSKLTREEAIQYLDDRKAKGFNVIQVMGLHTLGVVNMYGDSALVGKNVAKPKITKGDSFANATQYDFWNHVDFVIEQAEKRGIYIGFVPIWGGNVKEGHVTENQARTYAEFLANRYANRSNIIWLNGGDIKGSDSINIWNIIGNTLRKFDKKHLITFHPRGRTSSSEWFHHEKWMDFNMVQSGHRTYAQDTSANEKLHYGEDNWKYIKADYELRPILPTIDGEPSYEGIPQGLHDVTQPRWTAADVRRYGYWSVFAGAFGYTYGQNSVMQMYRTIKKEDTSFGPLEIWSDGMKAVGSGQMQYLKKLLLSKPYFERIPDQNLVINQDEKYNYVVATRGKKYAFFYTYTGRNFMVNLGKIQGKSLKATWYNPRNGEMIILGNFPNKGTQEFNPPAEPKDGNDWVLILE